MVLESNLDLFCALLSTLSTVNCSAAVDQSHTFAVSLSLSPFYFILWRSVFDFQLLAEKYCPLLFEIVEKIKIRVGTFLMPSPSCKIPSCHLRHQDSPRFLYFVSEAQPMRGDRQRLTHVVPAGLPSHLVTTTLFLSNPSKR